MSPAQSDRELEGNRVARRQWASESFFIHFFGYGVRPRGENCVAQRVTEFSKYG